MESIGAIPAEILTHGTGPVPDIRQFTGAHLSGFGRHAINTRNKRRVTEAARLYADVMNGVEDPFLLREAMSPRTEYAVMYLMEKYPGLYGDPGGRSLGLRETMAVTDYQALYVDVLDRMYYGQFQATPVVSRPLVRSHTLRDFRVVSRYMLDGMVSPYTAINPAAPATRQSLYGPVPQGGSTLPTASTAPIQYTPQAYQSETAVNWAAKVNDDLGIFRQLSMNLATEGSRGISLFLCQQFIDANGPNALLYTSGFGNIINIANGASANNPPLNAQGLADGFKVLAAMKDSSGYPIPMPTTVYLYYGPSLYAAVENLLAAPTVQASVEGGVTNSDGFPSFFLQVNNWMRAKVIPIMDPFIPIVCTDATKKFTTWAMVADPNSVPRPAVEFGTLSGFDTPQIFRKLPNTMRVGGGVEEAMGDFYTMDEELKIVGVMGAGKMDGRSTVGSNGSGS